MTNHYDIDLTSEEYNDEYDARIALTFGEHIPRAVIASLPSLEGVVECGVGKDDQEAREDYLEKLEMLITELEEKRMKVLYGAVNLEYTTVGSM